MTLPAGSGQFDLPLPHGHATDRLPIWYHRPEGAAADRPIVIVLHGTGRAAQTARNNWIAPANARGFIVAVPEFQSQHFSDPDYAYGRLWSPTPPHRRIDWEHSHGPMLDLLFDRLNLELGGGQRQFTLYGHSAGAAFAHRYLAFVPKGRVQQAIFANCGWYTFPDAEQPVPFGLDGADMPPAQLRAFLETPVTLLVGDRDLGGPYPGWWPEGFAAQGAHRVARSLRYLEVARHRAERLNAGFCWRWQAVPGAAHENAKMIAPAVRILAEGWARGGTHCS